jgi:hypothetical protein
MRIPIPYAGHFEADPNLRDYVSYLIRSNGKELHERNMYAWERWYHAMEVE